MGLAATRIVLPKQPVGYLRKLVTSFALDISPEYPSITVKDLNGYMFGAILIFLCYIPIPQSNKGSSKLFEDHTLRTWYPYPLQHWGEFSEESLVAPVIIPTVYTYPALVLFRYSQYMKLHDNQLSAPVTCR